MLSIRQRIAEVRARQQWQWVGQSVAWGLIAGGLFGCLMGGLMLTQAIGPAGWTWMILGLLAGPFLGFGWAMFKPRAMRTAALAIDQRYGFKDRAVTAWAFLSEAGRSPLQELQLQDAETHLQGVEPAHVVPLTLPRPLTTGVGLTIAAVLLAFFAPSPVPAVAALAPNEVVIDQAARLEAELSQLEKFNNEEPDTEIEQLLKELSKKLEELQQPGIDPREALAKLSEMQAALEARQQELSAPSTATQLMRVGEALSLAEPLKAAGEALSNGEYAKAAEELQKQDMPQLDRQTERSLTEKLDQLQQGAADGQRGKLSDAVGQISSGLSQGNKSKFSDGMNGLAGEAKKQGRRNKLSDLLRKQCQCLSECKSECESACQNPGLCNKPGGTKAGTAASGNEAGDKTPLLSSSKQMNLTGQESASGEVDVETMTSENQQQAAVREYQAKVDKYKQLNESVLDSEPIPLGHRQTIRRYFEMIRPNATEADAVQQQIQDGPETK